MAGKGFVSVGGKYEQLKSGFVTLNGVYKKLKEGFATVGGVFRKIFGGSQLTYKGTGTPLTIERGYIGSATLENYCLFAGGLFTSSLTTVDAYNKGLTHQSVTGLTKPVYDCAGIGVGEYAFFGGGYNPQEVDYPRNLNVYNGALTKLTDIMLTYGRTTMKGARAGTYALFCGGQVSAGAVEVISQDLTKSSATTFPWTPADIGGGTVADNAVFGGGASGSFRFNGVAKYDPALTMSRLDTLSEGRNEIACPYGANLLFCGGALEYSYSDNVDCYDSAFTHKTIEPLSFARAEFSGECLNEQYIVGGGGGYATVATTIVDCYDASLTKYVVQELSVARKALACSKVGNNILFAGGTLPNNYYNTVDIYSV